MATSSVQDRIEVLTYRYYDGTNPLFALYHDTLCWVSRDFERVQRGERRGLHLDLEDIRGRTTVLPRGAPSSVSPGGAASR